MLAPYEKFSPELVKPKIVVGNHLPKLRIESTSKMYESPNEAGSDAYNTIKNRIFLPGHKKYVKHIFLFIFSSFYLSLSSFFLFHSLTHTEMHTKKLGFLGWGTAH